jgi:hypothetical protein
MEGSGWLLVLTGVVSGVLASDGGWLIDDLVMYCRRKLPREFLILKKEIFDLFNFVVMVEEDRSRKRESEPLHFQPWERVSAAFSEGSQVLDYRIFVQSLSKIADTVVSFLLCFF